MKRPFLLRLPFRLLPVIAVLALLSCRASVRRNIGSESPTASVDRVFSNATLLRLASEDLAEAVVRRDVDELMEGKFPATARDGSLVRRHHIDGVWRRENRHVSMEIRTRFHSFQHNKFFPELRRSLRAWWGNRRFQPEIMAELVELVKLPLDRHHGRADSSRRFASCAVVGNSGILLKNDHGELIDGHDLVIRLNNARIHGYQRNVGSKTGLSFVNSNILHLCARRPGCFCHPYGENVPMIMYICQAAHFLDYTVCNSSYKAPLLITDIRFDMLCSRIAKYYSLKRFAEVTGKPLKDWAKFHDEKLFHYSSGMQAVMLALGICDQVRVFGFGKSAEAKHHYHTNQKVELDLHDYAAEYAFYQDLIDRPEAVFGVLAELCWGLQWRRHQTTLGLALSFYCTVLPRDLKLRSSTAIVVPLSAGARSTSNEPVIRSLEKMKEKIKPLMDNYCRMLEKNQELLEKENKTLLSMLKNKQYESEPKYFVTMPPDD